MQQDIWHLEEQHFVARNPYPENLHSLRQSQNDYQFSGSGSGSKKLTTMLALMIFFMRELEWNRFSMIDVVTYTSANQE